MAVAAAVVAGDRRELVAAAVAGSRRVESWYAGWGACRQGHGVGTWSLGDRPVCRGSAAGSGQRWLEVGFVGEAWV